MTTIKSEATVDANAAPTGPWLAVLAWRDGEVASLADIDGDDLDEVEISIVRGSAAPVLGGGGHRRLPGSYASKDMLVEFDGEDFDTLDDFRKRWEQAQAMVAGLNGSPNTARRGDA